MPLRFAQQQRIIPLMMLLGLLLTVILPSTFAQEDNICRDADAPVIEYGETLIGSIDPNISVTFFCFDADRATDVTITIAPTTRNLNTLLVVGTPFIDDEGLADEVLLVEESPANGGAYQGTVSIPEDGTYLILIQADQNVQGTFQITLELSGGNVLEPSNDEENDDIEDDTPIDSSGGISNIIPGETDLCATIFSSDIAYDELVEGSAGTDPAFYCFEASEGEIVTIDFAIEDVPMGFLMVEPLFDFTRDSIVYLQGIAEFEGQEVSDEVVIPADGKYVIFVTPLEEATGNFSLTVSAVAGNVYTCQNEPLNTLISRQWGIVDENGVAVIEINVTCSDRLSISTFGGAVVAPYEITQEDEFFFEYQGQLYFTTLLSDTAWVIEGDDDGQAYTLQVLTDEDTCTDDALSVLMQGLWVWELDRGQRFFFDFTCNGIVLIDDQQSETLVVSYEFDGEEIDISDILFGNVPLVFENVEVNEDTLIVEFSGISFELLNVLFEAEDEE